MQNEIVGVWMLESFEIEALTGSRRPWGKNAHGILIYTHSGHMSVSINRDVEHKSDVAIQNTYDSILFYSGTYSMNENVITHQVTQASNPERVGKTLIRFASLSRVILSLSSPKESFGTAHLKWRKISR